VASRSETDWIGKANPNNAWAVVNGVEEPTSQEDDKQEIRHQIEQTLTVIWGPEQIGELTGYRSGGRRPKSSGIRFYDKKGIESAITEALYLSGKAKGVYVTLNPIRPDIIDHGWNECNIARSGTLTEDGDILRRRWLLVDADPNRKGVVGSSDDEKAKAYEVIRAVREQLARDGLAGAGYCDSGNGYHLLYRVDLPANDEGVVRKSWKPCLGDLALIQ